MPSRRTSSDIVVGSPERLNISIDNSDLGELASLHSAPQNDDYEPLAVSQRPDLAHRSASSPLARSYPQPGPRLRMTQTRPPSRQSSVNPATERQWTLFGQMLDEHRGGSLRSVSRRRRAAIPSAFRPLDSSAHSAASANSTRPPTVVESDTDSDASSEETINAQTPPARQSRISHFLSTYNLPVLWRNVLKCSLAYLIASLFTFVPALSALISDVTSYGKGGGGPSPSAHMVATVAVYFNPAKTGGAMIEADLYCLCGLAWAAFVTLGSMSMFWFLEVRSGFEWIGELVVIVWIALGMTAVAWMKVWIARPSFNTACSMTSIILFIVIVKEGGIQQLLQVTFIVVMGAIVSNLVCVVMWPQSAMELLQGTMVKTLDSFATLLPMLTDRFLLEDAGLLRASSRAKLQTAIDAHQSSFVSLKKHLQESQSGWILMGPSNAQRQAYSDAVDSITRLGQHLGGLRSGVRFQEDLMAGWEERYRHEYDEMTGSLDISSSDDRQTVPEETRLQDAAIAFRDFIDDLEPPLKALSTSCSSALSQLRQVFNFGSGRRNREKLKAQDFQDLVKSLERALFLFESTSNHAVLRVYRRSDLRRTSSASSLEGVGDTALMSDESETVLLAYFFIFTLQEFTRELVALVDALGRIQLARASTATPNLATTLKAVSIFRRNVPREGASDRAKEKRRLAKRFSTLLPSHLRPHASWFPKIRPHAPNTFATPGSEDLSRWGSIKQIFWRIGRRLREPDTKYAIKAGVATAVLAAPAFFDSTRPIFTQFRGEWALISFFVVISPTIGGTNFLSLYRVLGTIAGALAAVFIFTLFPETPAVLAIFGFFFSMPCFYLIVGKPKYATSGRFVLLTYNLSCLYCYNARLRDISIIEIAWRRSASVVIGVLWAVIVSHFWWPAEARRELGKGLSEFCIHLGWLYSRLVLSYSAPLHLNEGPGARDSEFRTPADERTPLLPPGVVDKLHSSIEQFMAMELHLQVKLIELESLLSQTQHEPRLKGPFPIALFRKLLTSLQSILDKLHSMRCVTTREEWFTNVQRTFVKPVNKERREMVGNVLLFFSTLSSAFRLKAPLPPYLPPAELSRLRLVHAMRQLDILQHREKTKVSLELLFFAYVLCMKGITLELEKLGETLQQAYGLIGMRNRDEFEGWFRDEEWFSAA